MKIPSAIPFAMLALACACFAAPTAALADPAACLAAARADDSAHSYRMVMNTSFRGQTLTTTIDLVRPNRFHLTEPGIEMIGIGKKAWKRAGSAWQPMPGFDIGDFPTAQTNLTSWAGSCVDGGIGAWRGQPAHLFRGTSVRNGKQSVATIYVFADGFVHHVDVKSANSLVEMDISNFNTTTVNAPT